jgi:hypothetical protein
VAGLIVAGILAAAASATPPPATLRTFAGEWVGHTRILKVTRAGRATEQVDDGCCTRVYSVTLQLSRPRGTARTATVTARVAAVHVYERAFARSHPFLRPGAVGRLTLRNGVVTDSLTGVTYCNQAADRRGTCGA